MIMSPVHRHALAQRPVIGYARLPMQESAHNQAPRRARGEV